MIGTQYTLTNKAGDTFTINDHSDPNRVFALQEYPINDVSIKNNEINLQGQHGVWDFYAYYGSRITTFSGVIIGNNEAEVTEIKNQIDKILRLPIAPSDSNDGSITIAYTDPLGASWSYQGRLFRSQIVSRPLGEQYRLNYSFSVKSQDPFIVGRQHDVTTTYGYFIKGVSLPTPIPLAFVNEWQPKYDLTIDRYPVVGENKEYTRQPNQDTISYAVQPNEDYSNTAELYIHNDTNSYIGFNQDELRAFLDLDPVYSVDQIEKVELLVYSTLAVSDTAPTTAKRITESWTDSTLTYNNRPSVTDTDSTLSATGWIDGAVGTLGKLDITEIAKGWINGDYPCYGVELSSSSNDFIFLGSLEAVINHRPKIVVTYKDAVVLPKYNGNITSHAIYTITNNNPNNAPMTNPRIVDVERNLQTKINTVLEVGQTITIDTKKGTAIDNLGNDLSGLITDDSVFVRVGESRYLPIFTADEQPQNVLYYPQGSLRAIFNDTTI